MLEPAPSVARGPADLLAAMPYVVGAHLDQCVIVVFVNPDDRLTDVVAFDRETPLSVKVEQSIAMASTTATGAAYVVGYGPLSDRDQLIELADKLHTAVPVGHCLLVCGDRYYCLVADCPCTPAGGAVLDPDSSVLPAEMAFRGLVALPSGQAVDDFIAVDTDARERITASLAALPELLPDPVDVVHNSMAIARSGDRLTDEQAAHLAVALTITGGLVAAWRATTDQQWQHDLWRDLTRRVPDAYVTTPANLVAWTAWRRRESLLAWTALTRAATMAPDNSLSVLIATFLTTPLKPEKLPWPPPEDFPVERLLG
ncbi:DUF4192 domain-containing protein [Actinoplanes sp. GCM10030250]|uniref:DUF4192 domain-containing protein n=1 Tax=Actinoplanes sp. GCM10030250 TaxID=3273376 RepID=UPI00361BCFE0